MDFLAGNRIEPLIEAAETYPALEQAIAGARESVHMAYWTIDPSLPLCSDVLVGGARLADAQGEPKEQPSWLDLIAAKVSEGVTVRILIADFDPVLGREFHEAAWTAYRRFLQIRDRLPEPAHDRLKVVCTRHEARIGQTVRIITQPVIRRYLKESRDVLRRIQAEDGRQAALDKLGNMPGLWRYIRPFGRGGFSLMPNAWPTVYPAAHHEKLCVVDDRVVFLGGLDIDEQRNDSQAHENDFAWHDVACRVEGPIAAHLADHFKRRWNAEIEDYLAFLRKTRRPRAVAPLPVPGAVEKLKVALSPDDGAAGNYAEAGNGTGAGGQQSQTAHAGPAEAVALRTISAQMKSSFSRSPRNVVAEIRDGYLWAIGSAERLIYIETQFLRSQTIVEALVARARQVEALEIILLLPLLPENLIRFREPNGATTKGQELQERAVHTLREELAERVGIFTLLRSGSGEIDPEAERGKVVESMIYVHAKTMVVDDRLALIGSANLNDRSLLCDTETAVLWRHPESVRRYRERLWRHALGLDVSDWEEGLLARWKKIAHRNIRLPAAERQGYVVPLSEPAVEAFAENSLLVPTELV